MLIAVSQRVGKDPDTHEVRDQLDQRWTKLFESLNILPILVPNSPKFAFEIMMNLKPEGIILTGGNDLARYGGKTPERDQTELCLLKFAIEKKVPLLGVCRGMQVIQDFFNVPLQPITGHVTQKQEIRVNGKVEVHNSFHNFGARQTVPELEVWAETSDGIVKGVRHKNLKIMGWMWHPEREIPFKESELSAIKDFFGIGGDL